jgi:protein-S-isoprenylcysteine O-methyltransferase Ste14
MPGLALAFLALFAALAWGLRMAVQVRRTGSTGFVGVRGAPGSTERRVGALFPAAVGICVAGPLFQLAGLEPVAALEGDAGTIIGICLAATGIALTVFAQFAMGDAWRVGVDPGEHTELVTGGIFSLVRNPIYTAMLLAFAGITLLAPNPVTIAGLALLAAALELQTRVVEEPHLARLHGRRYLAYAARVGRFLPGIGRLRAEESSDRAADRIG